MGEYKIKRKSKRKLATNIPPNVYQDVLLRDKRCIICGNQYNLECHHFIYRKHGGMGIEQNLVMLCNGCHIKIHTHKLDKTIIEQYLRKHYQYWDKNMLKYRKYNFQYINTHNN